jgi:hypothetical protein
MSMDKRTRARVFTAAALVAPVVLVQIGQAVLGGVGPRVSAASVSETAPAAEATTPTVKPAPKWTAAQTAAAAWLAKAGRPRVPDSPMVFVPAPERAPEARVQVDEGEKPLEPRPSLTLSGVIGRDGEEAALINGKMVRVGDTVHTGWKVESIDAKRMVVVVAGPRGDRFELSSSATPGRQP